MSDRKRKFGKIRPSASANVVATQCQRFSRIQSAPPRWHEQSRDTRYYSDCHSASSSLALPSVCRHLPRRDMTSRIRKSNRYRPCFILLSSSHFPKISNEQALGLDRAKKKIDIREEYFVRAHPVIIHTDVLTTGFRNSVP